MSNIGWETRLKIKSRVYKKKKKFKKKEKNLKKYVKKKRKKKKWGLKFIKTISFALEAPIVNTLQSILIWFCYIYSQVIKTSLVV